VLIIWSWLVEALVGITQQVAAVQVGLEQEPGLRLLLEQLTQLL
jgi:hypothetical protein